MLISRDQILKVVGTYDENEKGLGIRAEGPNGEHVIFRQKTSDDHTGLEVNLHDEGELDNDEILHNTDVRTDDENERPLGEKLKQDLSFYILNTNNSIILDVSPNQINQALKEIHEITAEKKKIKILTGENYKDEIAEFNQKSGVGSLSPSDIKKALNTLYIWVRPDEIQFTNQEGNDFISMAKYSHFMYILDYDKLNDFPVPLRIAIGEHSDAKLSEKN